MTIDRAWTPHPSAWYGSGVHDDLTYLFQAVNEEVEEFLEPIALSDAPQDPIAVISEIIEIVRWYESLGREVTDVERDQIRRTRAC